MPEQVYQNTLFIGLGGTGGRVLKELRKQIYEKYGEIPAGLGFMYVDSSLELMQQNDPTWLTSDGYNAQFTYRDFLNISLPGDGNTFIGNLKYYPNLKELAENCEGLRNYHPNYGAMQDRRIGRILIGASATSFKTMLFDHYHQLQDDTNSSHVNITIVTSLSGGTGSGAVVSVIAHILRMYPEKISIYATLPAVPYPYDHGRSLANTYAALRELNALNIGRLKVTDLVTGEKFLPEMPYDNSLNYCHHLQENKLFRLFLFDKFLNEYDKISNILYHNLWLNENDAAVESYRKYLDMYNSITEPEFDASTPEEKELVYARTKAVGSLGLYRIIYPKKQILRHIAYHVAVQSFNQMLFDKYVEGFGYVASPAPAAYLISEWELEQWRMSKSYLQLDRPILQDRHQYSQIRDEWDKIRWMILQEAQNHTDSPLEFMDGMYKTYYAEIFRREGVETFFQREINNIQVYANDIVSDYESRQLQEWLDGYKSLYGIIQQTKALLQNIHHRYNEEYECFMAEINERIQMDREEMDAIKRDFSNVNILIRKIKRPQFSLQFSDVLTRYYYQATVAKAIEFEQAILGRLEANLHSLLSDLELMKHIFLEEQQKAQDLAHAETLAPADTLYTIDWEEVYKYEKHLCANRHEMELMSVIGRQQFAQGGHKTAKEIASCIKEHHGIQITKRIYYNAIKRYDADLWMDKLLYGKNVVFELAMLIKSQKQPTMPLIIEQTLEKSIPHLRFNHAEVMIAECKNLPPSKSSWNNPRTAILIRIPRPSLPLSSFYTQIFMECLDKATNSLSKYIEVAIDNTNNEDEISITSVRTNFPIRFIACLPDLKRQYDQLMADERQRAKYMLHTEDSFTDLPSLEVEEYIESPIKNTKETVMTDISGFPLPPNS